MRADLDDRPAAPHELEGLAQCGSGPGGLEQDVAAVVRQGRNVRRERLRLRIERRVRPDPERHLPALRDRVAEGDRRRAEGPRGDHGQQPDRAAAAHDDPAARHRPGARQRLQRHRERFDHRAEAVVHL